MAPIHELVKVLEVCKVNPSSESPESATELSLPVTFFDILWLKHPASKSIHFYEFTSATPTSFSSVILPKLKHSLSLTLLHFLPLAGKLTWPANQPKPIILYTPNDGVSLTITESNADFNHLSGDKIREADEFHHYAPELEATDAEAPIVALQLTLFPGQGFCIGIATHHAVLDGKSVALFLKAWSYICKQVVRNETTCLSPELVPFFERSVIQDPERVDMYFVNKLLEFSADNKSLKLHPAEISPGLVRATFVLSSKDFKQLREKALSQEDKVCIEDPNQTKPLHLSKFVLTFAHTLACLAKAKAMKNDRQVTLIFAGDVRARLNPPAPANYVGNCIDGCVVVMKAEAVKSENCIVLFAQRVDKAIQELEKGIDYEKQKQKIEFFVTTDPASSLPIGVTGSTRLGFYEMDFGWGRPKKMEIISIDWNGSISFLESRDGSGGVELGLVLNKQEMEVFSSLFVKGIKGT